MSGPQHEYGVVVMVFYDPQQRDVSILHGENGGRTLPHSHVVRNVKQIGDWSGGTRDFSFAASRDDELKVAILVQAGSGGPILGVTRL